MILDNVQRMYTAMMWKRDPRVREWPLTNHWGSLPIAVILLAYSLLVLNGGQMAKKFGHINLKPWIKLYNCCQVLLSGYMFWEVVACGVSLNLNPFCSPTDLSDNPHSLRLVRATWIFMMSKIMDMWDTLFIILRGEMRRASYLHVFHHASVLFGVWLQSMYQPGGAASTSTAMNSFVHLIMYSYYFLSTLGPAVRKHLWWKRYLTMLQMAQFAALIVMTTTLRLPSCRRGIPIWVTVMPFVYLFVLLLLFLNYYIKAYMKMPTIETGPSRQQRKPKNNQPEATCCS